MPFTIYLIFPLQTLHEVNTVFLVLLSSEEKQELEKGLVAYI